jgi:hypothetical protein
LQTIALKRSHIYFIWFVFQVLGKIFAFGTIIILIIPFQNIGDIRNGRRTKVPMFDLETGARSGFKELEVSEDCGVVCY